MTERKKKIKKIVPTILIRNKDDLNSKWIADTLIISLDKAPQPE